MDFLFEKATTDDIVILTRLTKDVWDAMEHKEWLALYDDVSDYITNSLSVDMGLVYKAVDLETNQIGGMCIVTYPGIDSENLGYDIMLSESELLRVTHMDTIIVHPFYRGNGLQQKLISLAEQVALSAGFRYFMCTIHPDNKYSIENMKKCGYKVVKEVLKYGGLPRLILLKTENN